jgi:hypothetical protein
MISFSERHVLFSFLNETKITNQHLPIQTSFFSVPEDGIGDSK